MPITVRPARQTDLPFIYRFLCELEETDFDPALFEEYYLKNIVAEHCVYLVAVDDTDQAVGYLSCHGQILLHHCGWVFEIQEIFVQAEYRNRGVGTMLLLALEERIVSYPYASLEVTANINRTDTHIWYRVCGFIETHKKFTKGK